MDEIIPNVVDTPEFKEYMGEYIERFKKCLEGLN